MMKKEMISLIYSVSGRSRMKLNSATILRTSIQLTNLTGNEKNLLDTNAYSNYLRGDEKILSVLTYASIVYMSIFVPGELYAGFKSGTKNSWNRGLLTSFLKKPAVAVLDATTETSDIFSEIKNSLRKSGTPIPINDVWIASHCIETGSLLITNDEHFTAIPGLRLWDSADGV